MRRRDFIKGVVGSAIAWPIPALAQSPVGVVGFLNSASPDGFGEDVVLSYLNRNPDKRDLAAAALVVAAMDEAWCPQAPAAPSVQYKPH